MIFLSFNICGQIIGNSVFFDCSSKKWLQIVARLEIWAKIEHSFVRPILINFTLQIMSLVSQFVELKNEVFSGNSNSSSTFIGPFHFFFTAPLGKAPMFEKKFHGITYG